MSTEIFRYLRENRTKIAVAIELMACCRSPSEKLTGLDLGLPFDCIIFNKNYCLCMRLYNLTKRFKYTQES